MTAGTRCRGPIGPSVTPVPGPARLPVRRSAPLRPNPRLVPSEQIDPTGTVMPKVAHKNPDQPRSSAAC